MNHLNHFAEQLKNQFSGLKGEEIYTFISNRYNCFEKLSKMKLQHLKARGNTEPALTLHNSACRQSEKGIPLYIQGNDPLGGVGGNPDESDNPLLLNRKGFKFVTLLVAAKDVLADIRLIFEEK